MKAGQLDQRIHLERLSEGRDKYGQPVFEWLYVLSAWAAVEPLTGREYHAAMATAAESTQRIRMRHRQDVTPDLRVKHGDLYYDIQSVADVDSQGRELHLMCKRVQ